MSDTHASYLQCRECDSMTPVCDHVPADVDRLFARVGAAEAEVARLTARVEEALERAEKAERAEATVWLTVDVLQAEAAGVTASAMMAEVELEALRLAVRNYFDEKDDSPGAGGLHVLQMIEYEQRIRELVSASVPLVDAGKVKP